MNLMLYEMTCGNPVTPYRLTQSVSRWGLSEGQGCALQPHAAHMYMDSRNPGREAIRIPADCVSILNFNFAD